MMHIPSMKGVTKDKKIESFKAPPIVYVPLLENFGNVPEPLVLVGEKVKKYQLIGKASKGFSAKIHSSVSGTVTKVYKQLQADGKRSVSVVIENDFQETEWEPGRHKKEEYSPEELLEIIEDAGIVGEGGAQYPTTLKYKVKDKNIHTFVINGAECEPYLTADYAIMAEKTKELLEGIHLANKILKAEKVIIGIERQNKELEKMFLSYLGEDKYKNYKIALVSNEYPQGGELQLIKSVVNIEIPKDKRPVDYGIIVSNIGTLYAIYDAVINGKPVVNRIVTISGEKSRNFGNYEIKIGTPISHILDTIEYSEKEPVIISGGPMMGKCIYDYSTPIHKGAAGLLLLKRRHFDRLACISCGYCVDVCPMYLMPMKYEEFYRKRKYSKLKKYNISDCIDCGACEYICPCNVPLLESIHQGKIKLKELENEAK